MDHLKTVYINFVQYAILPEETAFLSCRLIEVNTSREKANDLLILIRRTSLYK